MRTHIWKGEPSKTFLISVFKRGITIKFFIILWKDILVLYAFTYEPRLTGTSGEVIVRDRTAFMGFIFIK
jgi:hypothetical protein